MAVDLDHSSSCLTPADAGRRPVRFLLSRAIPFADAADLMLSVLDRQAICRAFAGFDKLLVRLHVRLVEIDFGGSFTRAVECLRCHRIWFVYRGRNGRWPRGWLHCSRCNARQKQGAV